MLYTHKIATKNPIIEKIIFGLILVYTPGIAIVLWKFLDAYPFTYRLEGFALHLMGLQVDQLHPTNVQKIVLGVLCAIPAYFISTFSWIFICNSIKYVFDKISFGLSAFRARFGKLGFISFALGVGAYYLLKSYTSFLPWLAAQTTALGIEKAWLHFIIEAVGLSLICAAVILTIISLSQKLLVKVKRQQEIIAHKKTVYAAWDDIVLAEELKQELIQSIFHFVNGSSAAPRGLLLYGPPGTGKTLIARKMADTADCAFFAVSPSGLKKKHVGHSAAAVKELWEEAFTYERAIIFLDECDAIFPQRGGENEDTFTAEILQAFLAEWDGFSKQTTVWVIGATNRRDILDGAIRSRFGEEIEIPLPNAVQRLEILKRELAKHGISSSLPKDAALYTQGLSGRDLDDLAKKLIRKMGPDNQISDALLKETTKSKRTQNSSASDENATWENLILDNKTLKLLKSTASLLQHADTFKSRGISVPRGILLYGPPGTGKTQIARTLAKESGLQFIAAGVADIKANYLGQSANRVKNLFERARSLAPSILFIDEIDIVAPDRSQSEHDALTREITGQLLQELDGIKSLVGQVFLLAATNLPDSIDAAIRSRFPSMIEIPLPDENCRSQILTVFLKSKPLSFELQEGALALAQRTENLSGRDLRNAVERAEQNAVMRAIEEGDADKVKITMKDFEETTFA